MTLNDPFALKQNVPHLNNDLNTVTDGVIGSYHGVVFN